MPSIPTIHNLPGKEKTKSGKKSTPTVKPKKKVTGKCSGCNVIWKSKEDLAFQKLYGIRKSTWIGCDNIRCSFWAHVMCTDIILKHKKTMKDHKFLCPNHKV